MVRENTRGSHPAWKKPVDQGSNPCVPTLFLMLSGKSDSRLYCTCGDFTEPTGPWAAPRVA